jgi:hypothetical protein
MEIDIPITTPTISEDDALTLRTQVFLAAQSLGLTPRFDQGRIVNTRDRGRVYRIEGFRLSPGPNDAYRAHSAPWTDAERERGVGRKKQAVCFHGHREWMRAVLTTYPDAAIHSSRATWFGLRHFEDNYLAALPDRRTESCRCIIAPGYTEPYDPQHLADLNRKR